MQWFKLRFLGILLILNPILALGHPWIKTNAPKHYVVKPDDTLWHISEMFLHDPARWEQVWRANPDIANPNLIYPGDYLRLTYVKGHPRIKRIEHLSEHGVHRTRHGRVVKLRPKVRTYSSLIPIPTLPRNIIKPFLNDSQVVSTDIDEYSKIIALDEDHIAVGAGDRIYVDKLNPVQFEKPYFIFRPNKEYLDPKTGEVLGMQGINLGKAKLDIVGQPASLIISESREEILIGDRVAFAPPAPDAAYISPKIPKGNPRGQIISVFGGINQIGQYQVVVVTGGKNRGRRLGDVLSILQRQKDLPSRLRYTEEEELEFPFLKVGVCLVFNVFDKVSYALVMKANRAIYLYDSVGNPLL